MRQALADGTAGHGDDRRQGAQGTAAGRRLAHHIQAHVAQEVQRWRFRRRRRPRRLRGAGRLVVGQGRPERAPARVRRPVGRGGRCGRGLRHVAVLATAAADVSFVRTTRLPRGRLTAPPPPVAARISTTAAARTTVNALLANNIFSVTAVAPVSCVGARGSRASVIVSGKLVTPSSP